MDASTTPNATPEDSSATQSSKQSHDLKRKSNDIGWEYGKLIDPNNADKVSCKLCGKNMSGGVYRMKEHIAGIPGNVAKCLKAKEEDKKKCREAIIEAKKKKQKKIQDDDDRRGEVLIRGMQDSNSFEELRSVDTSGSNKGATIVGAMDRYTKVINPEVGLRERQKSIKSIDKDALTEVYKYIGRWAFRRNVPLNAIDNPDWDMMVEAIGQYGRGLQGPSHYQLSTPILKSEVEWTREMLNTQREEWKKGGCSVMTDAWTDRKRRSIMNMCVNYRLGTCFFSMKECHGDSHTGELIYEYVKKSIVEIGHEKVVQVVTDNASNNMVAAKLLKRDMPNIFRTSCASHTINLMLEAIGKLPRYEKTIEQAKSYTTFIYAHHLTLALMRNFTRKGELVRPGVTRFASAFLTLQSLWENKDSLKVMFNSDEWKLCRFSRTKKGKEAFEITISNLFWNGVRNCLKIFAPLVHVLRVADADHRPSMAYLYGELIKAKEEIQVAYNGIESNYKPVFDIIESRSKGRLDSPLHMVGYLLNPYFLYKNDRIALHENLMDALQACVEAFFPNQIRIQDDIVVVDFIKYKNKEGPFRKPLSIRWIDLEDFNPVEWWKICGTSVPNLQIVAVKVLGLTTSSSGCERNWSTFEGIHTKKRNKLTPSRLHDLVFVQFNARLFEQRRRLSEPEVDVLCGEDCKTAKGWIVRGGDNGSDDDGDDVDACRTLEDDDFVSEDEEEDNEDVDLGLGITDDYNAP